MKGFTTLFGVITALALLALGLLVLPEPGISSTAGLFTALWIFIALAAVTAFGREALRRERFIRVQKSLRRSAGKAFLRPRHEGATAHSRGEFIRQRGRRTDE
jgi:hypothetical protein